MTPELLAQIAATVIAVTALYKAWGGARKDDLDNLRQIIQEQGERLLELECENKSLRSENATLHERMNILRVDMSAVQADNAALRRENEALRAEVSALRVEVEEYRTGKRKKPSTGPLE